MSKRVLMQGLLYGVVLFLTLIFPLIQVFFSGTKSAPSVTLRILTVTFTPWQGFFNAIIYSIPVFIKWRRDRDGSVSSDRLSLFLLQKKYLSGISKRFSRSNSRLSDQTSSQHQDASNSISAIATSAKEKRERSILLTNSNGTQNCTSTPAEMINIDLNTTDAENGITKTTIPKKSSEISQIETKMLSHEEVISSQADADETDKCQSLVADDSLQDTLYASEKLGQGLDHVMAAPRRKSVSFKEEEAILQQNNELIKSIPDCSDEHSEEDIGSQLTFFDGIGQDEYQDDYQDDYLNLLHETDERII